MVRSRPASFYVSVEGDDEWSGTMPEMTRDRCDGPFATLERARNAVREIKGLAYGGVTVNIRGGTYLMDRTFNLTSEDSGSKDSPIIYRPFQGQSVRLIGGRILEGFKPIRDHDRLGKEALNHVMQLDLGAMGISDYGSLVSRGFGRGTQPAHMELFFQGRRMQLARWPNDGFFRIDAPAEDLPEGDGHGGKLGRIEAGFIYHGDRPSRWRDLEDVWVHGYWAWDWANSYERIGSIDLDTGHISTFPPHGVYGVKAGQRFYFLNILEELDRPGEYYLDRRKGILYFWPPADLAANEAAVSLLETPMIRLDNVQNVNIRGLTLEYSRGNGVEIHGGSSITIAGCIVRNLGNNGIVVRGGEEHSLVSCDIYNVGDGGIYIEGGDRLTLKPSGHSVENNHIHHMGEWTRCYQPGVMVRGVGIRIAHNLIHEGPHNAIQLSGNEHLIEFNHVHHVCQETGDVGAFYMGRDWTQRGNVVRYNFFHDTQGVGMGSMAVYLDDCASGTTVYGNVFHSCTRAVFIGGGRDNLVENNVFVDCKPAIMIDGRGLDPSPIWHNMVYKTMKKLLDEVKHHEPPYGSKYPELVQLDAYYKENRGIPPEGNRILRNASFGGEWLDIHWHAEPGMIIVKDNLVEGGHHSLDTGSMYLLPRDGSLAYKLGFKRIPIEMIGLHDDEYRTVVTMERGKPWGKEPQGV